MPTIVATTFCASSHGQRTHSIQTNNGELIEGMKTMKHEIHKPWETRIWSMKYEPWNMRTWGHERGAEDGFSMMDFESPLSRFSCSPDCCPPGLHFSTLGPCISGNWAVWHHSWVLFLLFALYTFSVTIWMVWFSASIENKVSSYWEFGELNQVEYQPQLGRIYI